MRSPSWHSQSWLRLYGGAQSVIPMSYELR